MANVSSSSQQQFGLYTVAQRTRRDNTIWTLVQGILAPLQFVVFLVSLGFVMRYMLTGDGLRGYDRIDHRKNWTFVSDHGDRCDLGKSGLSGNGFLRPRSFGRTCSALA